MNIESKDLRIKYLRDKNNKPYATFVSFDIDGELYFGCSLCNKKDKFIKKVGIRLAVACSLHSELVKNKFNSEVIPESIKKEFTIWCRDRIEYILENKK